jgi:hypothetical protein
MGPRTFSSQSSRDPLNGSARAYARRLAARLRRFHTMMSSCSSSNSAAVRRSSASSSTINTARRFCCDCPICAPSLSVRYDRPVIDARAPPPDPAAGRKQRRQMSSVTLPQASAGAALFGRAVLGPLDDASRLVPPRGTFPGRLRVPMSTMRQWGICSGGSGYFFAWQGTAMVPGATAPHLFDFSEGYGRSLIW